MAAADIRKNSYSFNLKSFNINSRSLIVLKIIYIYFHICQPAKFSQISRRNLISRLIFNRYGEKDTREGEKTLMLLQAERKIKIQN